MWTYIWAHFISALNIADDFLLGQPKDMKRTFPNAEAKELHQLEREQYGEELASRGVWIVIVLILVPTLIVAWIWGSTGYRKPTTAQLPLPSSQQQEWETAPDASPSSGASPTPPPNTEVAPVPTPDGTGNTPQSDNPIALFGNDDDAPISAPLDPDPPELQSGVRIDDIPPVRKTATSGTQPSTPPERPKLSGALNPTEAVAQTQYFLRALEWGWNKGDTQFLAEVSSESCETCQKAISDITRGRKAGHQVNRVSFRIGDDISVGKGKAKGNNAAQEWHVIFTLHTSGHSIYNGFNSIEVPPHEGPVRIVLRKENNVWKVVGYYAAKR